MAGAVVLLLDSSLTTHARTLTGLPHFCHRRRYDRRFHLKLMRIGFTPTESSSFDPSRDTTIDVALAPNALVHPLDLKLQP
ncbi:MAG TPA: hypothetical protein VGH98_20800 [Gemmatimonadaceae bacterium]